MAAPIDPLRVKRAKADFVRMMIWICAIGVLMVIGALYYLSRGDGPLTIHMIVAAIAGVFFSVVLGTGLMAAAFFSDKSGHDERATGAPAKPSAPPPDPTDD